MLKKMTFSLALLATSLLTGCQGATTELSQVTSTLQTLSGGPSVHNSGTGAGVGASIANQWGVTDNQAMAWLAHNNMAWSDNGRLNGVNWYSFWAQQIHARTPLAQQGYQYCHAPAWSSMPLGGNCVTYMSAHGDVNSEEMMDSFK